VIKGSERAITLAAGIRARTDTASDRAKEGSSRSRKDAQGNLEALHDVVEATQCRGRHGPKAWMSAVGNLSHGNLDRARGDPWKRTISRSLDQVFH